MPVCGRFFWRLLTEVRAAREDVRELDEVRGAPHKFCPLARLFGTRYSGGWVLVGGANGRARGQYDSVR